MPDRAKELLRHLIVEGFSERTGYSRPKSGGSEVVVPPQDRGLHGSHLLGQLRGLSSDMISAIQIQKKAGIEFDNGLSIEFESFPGFKVSANFTPS